MLAGPGTGKTATLVEAVAERITHRGVAPSQVLVLTFSRRAAAELTERISRRVGVTTREPMVRTLHGYAYALLRAGAGAVGEPQPRLLGAGESDLMVRELLAGHAETGGGRWPAHLRRALAVPAFADQLRDLLLRAEERQIPPAVIAALGRRHRRPEWSAVAAFAREYQQVSDLRQGAGRMGAALDQAELTTAALALLSDPAVRSVEQARVRRIFVDEYQDVDPGQVALIETLAEGADELVVVGDPDQSIYAFRGSDPAALRRIEVDGTVQLTLSRRLPHALAAATRRVADRLPGPREHRALRAADSDSMGELEVRVLRTAAKQAAYIADQLRRAHLLDGVPWSKMAVLVRSPAGSAAALRRACAMAGVPVTSGAEQGPIAADPVVRTLLLLLRAGLDADSPNGSEALELLGSSPRGLDAVAIRRLRRAVLATMPDGGSSADVLGAVLRGTAPVPAGLPAELARSVRRLAALVSIARQEATASTAEELLWRIWQASGLAEELAATSERGGRSGRLADARLDAVLALFAMAADLVDRLPGAGLAAFLDVVAGQQISADGAGGALVHQDAVALLSAHAAKGLQWDVVAVAGVQEGSWPDLRPRGSLLGTDELLDAAAGLPPVPSTAARLAEERRLFYVATTRARRRLVVTAVADEDAVPSRFLAELLGTDELPTGWPREADGRERRGLHGAALVAELRSAVCDPQAPPGVAAQAANQLARLAAAGFTGADPADWYGLAEVSTAAPVVADGAPVAVSPSAVESLSNCALRAVLERSGARGAPGQPQIEGIVVHALADGLAKGVPTAELDTAVDAFLAGQRQLPPWQIDRTRRLVTAMRDTIRRWIAEVAADRTLLGSEVEVDVPLPAKQDCRPVRIAGRVDWLSGAADGSVIVTDFKTGATVPSKADAVANPQLAVYQLAIALGAFRSTALPGHDGPVRAQTDVAGVGALERAGSIQATGDRARSGGAELVYLRGGRPQVRSQPPLDAASSAQWQETVRAAAEQLAAGTATATQGRFCDRCRVRSSCPIQPQGRQVTR